MLSLARWRRFATHTAGRRFAAALAAAGYSHDRPDPRLAWRVFRDFSAVEFRVADDALLFHPIVPNPRHRAHVAELHLVRQFSHEWFGQQRHMEQLRFVLTYTDGAGLEPGTWRSLWTYNTPSRGEFFQQAESAAEFAALVQRGRPERSSLTFDVI